MDKIIIANWHLKEELKGGQETFFYELSKILNAKRISYWSCENVLQKNFFKEFELRPCVYQGYVIESYLKKYENLFDLNLIIKNSGVGGYEEFKTTNVIIFQDPFYSIQKFFLDRGIFFGEFLYNASLDLQRRTAKQGWTVAVSNFMKEDMKLNDIICDKVIEEGVDIEKFKPVENKEELKRSHNLPLDKKIGIAVTKFLNQKGWSILSELINKFPDIYWIVLFTSAIGKKPKLKNVTLIEEALPELMPRLYNCADFFINTSPVESFGLSACEAASCNIPIITYKTGFAWDWWDDRLGIRVDEWTSEAFFKAVQRISMDNQEYEPRKAIIERGFTLERMSKDWKDYTENLLKE